MDGTSDRPKEACPVVRVLLLLLPLCKQAYSIFLPVRLLDSPGRTAASLSVSLSVSPCSPGKRAPGGAQETQAACLKGAMAHTHARQLGSQIARGEMDQVLPVPGDGRTFSRRSFAAEECEQHGLAFLLS